MKAETALNVIEALSPDEAKRLFSMLGINKEVSGKKKRKPLITEAEATEYILNLYKKRPERRITGPNTKV